MLSGLLGLAAMSFFELALFRILGSHCESIVVLLSTFLTLRFCGAEELRSAYTPHPGHFSPLHTLPTIDVTLTVRRKLGVD